MTWKEMYDGLEDDAQKVQIRIDKSYPKAVKAFKKSRTFPAWYIDEYKIPATNNQYIIFYYAENAAEVEKPHNSSFCFVFSGKQRYVIRGMQMEYQHTPKCETIMLPQIHAYTSHFFQRYNERFLHKDNLSPNEIAGLFFVRNPFPIPIMLNEDVNKNYKKHGEHNDRGMRVPDGFCFTRTAIEGCESEDGIHEHDKVDAMLILYTTFMNESDMSDSQRDAINKEHFKTWMHCMVELRKG
ncbi:hypothetical protein [Prevotella sp. lc2012]|uniref:hypothetical protein n=1 Tax=Prevotella sp. lc2012 TaxID=1761886 RepID=UPI0008979F10|nr:hypothetical protein [Prevotella sp. lc2012]SEE30208.1 hypothetical protein SAMN04487828_1165 [Prevotella sp. lc2012]